MKADAKFHTDRSFLQELLDCPATITQADLSELREFERIYLIVKRNFDAAHEKSYEVLSFMEGVPVSRMERARAYRVAKNDFETAHAQIFEMLMFGFPGDGGPLVARLDCGRVVVDDANLDGEVDSHAR
jgi:hypothetical protein